MTIRQSFADLWPVWTNIDISGCFTYWSESGFTFKQRKKVIYGREMHRKRRNKRVE